MAGERRQMRTVRGSLYGPSSFVCCLLPTLAAAAEAAPKGMPQLDFANPLTISQIVWLVVVFAALYALLAAWALPKVGTVLDDRATRVARDLDSARAAKSAADAAAREVREAGTRARDDAQREINGTVEAAKRQAADRAAVQKATLDARMAEAEGRIAAARVEALASLRIVAIAAAITMIERLSGKPADPGAVDAAVGQLLTSQAG